MGPTRRVAERMIVERAARSRLIAQQLRDIAGRLDSCDDNLKLAAGLKNEAQQLRTLASQVKRL
jgi:hypothetical protein